MTQLVALGLGLQGLGLIVTVRGSWILLRGLFITDEEIAKLSDLPVYPSRLFTGADRLAASDPEKLDAYKNLYLQKRKAERQTGRKALWLFIVGFLLQFVGLLIGTLLAR